MLIGHAFIADDDRVMWRYRQVMILRDASVLPSIPFLAKWPVARRSMIMLLIARDIDTDT